MRLIMYWRNDGLVFLSFLVRRRPPPLGQVRVKLEEEAGEAMSSVSDILLRSYEYSGNVF